MEVENLILLSTQVLLWSNKVSLALPQNQKSTKLKKKVSNIHTWLFQENIQLNWHNSTHFSPTNPCFLQKTVDDISGDI